MLHLQYIQSVILISVLFLLLKTDSFTVQFWPIFDYCNDNNSLHLWWHASGLLCASNKTYCVRSKSVCVTVGLWLYSKKENDITLSFMLIFQVVHWFNRLAPRTPQKHTYLMAACTHTLPPPPPYPPVLVVCQLMSALLQAICQWRANHMWPWCVVSVNVSVWADSIHRSATLTHCVCWIRWWLPDRHSFVSQRLHSFTAVDFCGFWTQSCMAVKAPLRM